MQQLLRQGVVDAVGFWNSLARMEFLDGQTNTAFMVAKSGQYLANGYMWIPKGHSAPGPGADLRQLASERRGPVPAGELGYRARPVG